MKNRNNENELPSNEDYSKLRKPSFTPDNNADAISENRVAGINRVVGIEIHADGKPITHFKHFKLTQSAVRHHEFELILAHDSLENRQSENLEDANKLLGKRFTVSFKYKDSETESNPHKSFVGVITNVGFSREKTSLGDVTIRGCSPTIFLDGAPHTQSFGGDQSVNMGIIANEVIKQGIDTHFYDINVDTNDSSQILYSSQYNETHYNYLARMAEAYGEQFYYDGYVLHFGRLPKPVSKRIQLIEGSNVSDLNINLKAVYTKPQFYGYNSSRNEKLTSRATPIQHLGDLAQTAYANNDKIFKTPSLQVAPIKASTHLDVEYSQKSASGSKAVNVMNVSGSTSIPFLHPGCVADLKIRQQDSSKTRHLTRLMITETTHEVDARGYYIGSFEAISEGTGYMPKPEFHTPRPEPQIATVISNTDPLNQGRVQVRFDWQLNDTTDFIRVMTPDAGGTDQVMQNRGFVFIPEIGDQVMVDFQHGHPDRPFVMGSMFHGGTGLGGGVNNHMRTIQTRFGIKILMNNEEGSMTLLDAAGSSAFFDGQGSINLTAPKDITINAGENVSINAGQNISIDAGTNINTSATLNYTQTVGVNYTSNISGSVNSYVMGKVTEIFESDVHSETKKDRNEVSDGKIITQSTGTHEQHSDKTVDNNSSEKSNNF